MWHVPCTGWGWTPDRCMECDGVGDKKTPTYQIANAIQYRFMLSRLLTKEENTDTVQQIKHTNTQMLLQAQQWYVLSL